MLVSKLYQPKYHKQVIDLLGLLWINWSFELRDKVFLWKYLENPYCIEPQFFLMVEGEKVVAVRGFFVNAYLIEGKKVYAGIPADSVTLPEYRRRSFFKQLTEFALKYNAERNFPDFYLSLSSNPMAASGHQKTGFSLLGSWIEMYKFSPVGIFGGSGKNDFTEIPCKSCNYEISISYAIDLAEAAAFIQNEEVKSIHLLKDESFFSWRYRQPAFSYVFLSVKRGNELLAWASFILISKGRALMTDFHFSKMEAFDAGLNYLSRQMGIWAIQTRVFTNNENKLDGLKSLGFKDYKCFLEWIGKGNAVPVMLKTFGNEGTKPIQEIKEEYLSDPNNWDLHLIDSDGA